MIARLDDFRQEDIHAFDRVGGIDHPSDLRRKRKKGFPGPTPAGRLLPRWGTSAPTRPPRMRPAPPRPLRRRPQRRSGVASRPAACAPSNSRSQAVADQVHNAGLQRSFGDTTFKACAIPVRPSGTAIRMSSTRGCADRWTPSSRISYLRWSIHKPRTSRVPSRRIPSAKTPLCYAPQPRGLTPPAATVLLAFADLHPQRIEEHHRIDLLERPPLPCRHFR